MMLASAAEEAEFGGSGGGEGVKMSNLGKDAGTVV